MQTFLLTLMQSALGGNDLALAHASLSQQGCGKGRLVMKGWNSLYNWEDLNIFNIQILDKQRKRGRGVRRGDRLLPTLCFVFILLTLPNLADLVIQVLDNQSVTSRLETSRYRDFFQFFESIGLGLKNFGFEKKSQYRSRKYLVSKKSLGIGLENI